MADVTTTCREIGELTKNAQLACNLFMAKCKEAGLNVLITETYRSQERQDYLYSIGRTVSGAKVTWTLNSRHTCRRAWDICKNVKGQEYSDTAFFKACGAIANQLGITWGGIWSNPDTPHFEITENWTYNESEELTMTQYEELNNRLTALTDAVTEIANTVTKLKNPMIYNYIDNNMPDWAKPTIQKLVDKGILKGNENGLNLNDDMLRILVVLDRMGVCDK